ncbi:MAG TPA: acyl-CoA thioesterase II [Arachnia sp.]|nr:acyl-CoA thioesterase II [Arachnia sp.]HMT85448.1 acyl-CoA thioesterase II [Arachnia sp.]
MPKNVDDLLSLFALRQLDENTWQGPHPDTVLQRLFGGQVLAQTLMAASKTVAEERLPHSLNAYFLRPGSPDEPLLFEVERTRDGNTFSNRRVTTRQAGRVIFAMTASFQAGEAGLDHSALEPGDYVHRPPGECPSLGEIFVERFGAASPILAEWDALDVRLAGPPRRVERGGSMKAWVRTRDDMPDDPMLHLATLAYLSDITLLSVSTVPHEVAFLSPKMQMASVDHAMWFHRPVRVDDWLLYDMDSPSASNARGFSTGRLFQHGQIVASCAQEGLIRLLA